jgi:hypothetical protein
MLASVFSQVISTSKYFWPRKPLLPGRLGVYPHPKAALTTTRKGQKGRCPNLLQSRGRDFACFNTQIIPKSRKNSSKNQQKPAQPAFCQICPVFFNIFTYFHIFSCFFQIFKKKA